MKDYRKERKKHEYEEAEKILERLWKSPSLKLEPIERLIKNQELFDQWKSIVGSPIKDHTQPLSMKSGILTIGVDSSAWLHELTTVLKIPLIKTIRKDYPYIKDVRFRVFKKYKRY